MSQKLVATILNNNHRERILITKINKSYRVHLYRTKIKFSKVSQTSYKPNQIFKPMETIKSTSNHQFNGHNHQIKIYQTHFLKIEILKY